MKVDQLSLMSLQSKILMKRTSESISFQRYILSTVMYRRNITHFSSLNYNKNIFKVVKRNEFSFAKSLLINRNLIRLLY